MIEITDEMRAKAARAICRETCAEVGDLPCPDVGSHAECSCWGCADAALTAVAPLIAAAERERMEEAAKPGPMPTREEIEKFMADCAKWREENGFA
jgi:hypothetical protein